MTDLDDLRDELERLGRRPVPAPRPEFVDGLLTRIVGDVARTEVPAPIPLRPVARRRFASRRALALVSIAATLVLAVGIFGVLARGVGTTGDIEAEFSATGGTSTAVTGAPEAPPTTAAPLPTVDFRNETAESGELIQLGWDAYRGGGSDVVYVVVRTTTSDTTEVAVTGTTYTESVPTEAGKVSFALEVRAADGEVVARGNSLVVITVRPSS